MPFDAKEHISELQHTVFVANENYEIWWVYKSERERFVDAMNDYSIFFATSIHAHFAASLIAVCRLYDTDRRSYSIPGLLRLLRDNSSLDATALDCLDLMHSEMEPLREKVRVLRNKAFAHRDIGPTVVQLFRDVGLAGDDLRDLIMGSMKLLNALSSELMGCTYAFDASGAREDTIRLLSDIARARRHRAEHRGGD